MDFLKILQGFENTPVPAVLVAGGILFIFLAVGGRFGVSGEGISKKTSAIVGIVLLILGLGMYTVPLIISSSVTSTADGDGIYVQDEEPEHVSTPSVATPVSNLSDSGISDCNGNAVLDMWFGTDDAISHSYGHRISDTAWGAAADPAQSAMDVALAFGPYINLAPGQYRAVYRIKISGDESPNMPVVRLNIGAYVDRIDNPNLANRMISFGEVVNLDTFIDYEVPFVLSNCSTAVEFRAFYQNAGDIALDSITLIKE